MILCIYIYAIPNPKATAETMHYSRRKFNIVPTKMMVRRLPPLLLCPGNFLRGKLAVKLRECMCFRIIITYKETS